MSSQLTYDLSLLGRSHEKWRRSAALRAFYADLFADIRRELASGRLLELGSGIGTSREFMPDIVTSDVVPTAYAERVVSAYDIPAEDWVGIVAVDVLHHLEDPLRFLASAAAALRVGGRVVLAEPAATGLGRIFYSWCHHEPCQPASVQAPYRFHPEPDGSFANMGVAYALFQRDRLAVIGRELERLGLRLTRVRYRDVLAYPATGGFSRRSLLPAAAVRVLLAMERGVPPALLRRAGLRMIVVLERTASAP